MTALAEAPARGWRYLRGHAARILIGFRGRPDSEHEMGFNRTILGLLIVVYLHLASPAPEGLTLLWGYVLLGAAVTLWVAFDREVRPARRFAMMAVDIGIIAAMMRLNGAPGSALYLLFLWVIFGNGFRLGLTYLYAATGCAVAAFGYVLLATPIWWGSIYVGCGLLLGLVTLPLYAAALVRKLQRAQHAAEAASRAKSYFLASVSHELRTPLTAIIGLGEHLADADLGGDDRDMARTIVSAGRSLLLMINQLLDFSRVEASGTATVRADAFDLIELMSSVRGLMQVSAEAKGLRLGLHVRAGAPLALRGDEQRLRDILTNLIGNAIKFTEAGSVTIVADHAVENGRTLLRLAVVDTGIGIAPEAQGRIFESFVQADDSIIDRFGGTGLGLAICKQLVAVLGGTIWVESRPGEGSRFVFTAAVQPIEAESVPVAGERLVLLADEADADAWIDLLPPDAAIRFAGDAAEFRDAAAADPGALLLIGAGALAAAPDLLDPDLIARAPVLLGDRPAEAIEAWFGASVAAGGDARAIAEALLVAAAFTVRSGDAPVAGGATPRRILVADDTAMNRKVLTMILERAGHEVATAVNGEEALDRMKDHGFDIVLMDVNMPVMNGIEATKLYRFAALGQRHMPIVAVTADASPGNADRCLDAGMDACIGKPVDGPGLLAMIERLTGGTPAAPAATPGFDPSGTVTPLFAPADAEEPAIDPTGMAELMELGGAEFVDEVVAIYRTDSAAMLAAVEAAVAAGDVVAFRESSHALRSSAANIGAKRLAEICRHYQTIPEPEFAAKGERHARAMAAEIDRVRAALPAPSAAGSATG